MLFDFFFFFKQQNGGQWITNLHEKEAREVNQRVNLTLQSRNHSHPAHVSLLTKASGFG